jgi:hypothetical protein
VPVPQPPSNQAPKLALQEALKAAGIELPDDPALEHRDLGRRSPRGSADQTYEIVAQDLAEWLNRMPKILAAAMKGGPHRQAPFKYPATGKQKFDIFKGKLFNPDGTPNVQGRQEMLRRMTPRQYAEVVHIVTKEMRRGSGEMME